MNAHFVHEGHDGSVIDHPDDGYIETRWYDGSADFTSQTLNDRCVVFADIVEQTGQRKVLIDAVQFGMNAEDLDVEFRNGTVTPRLNAAGTEKIALIVPAGFPPADFPPVGAPPAPEGPADFPTAFFATRAEALAWLGA